MQNLLTFVCISDTHSLHNEIRLPKGDVLIHCGDFSALCEKKGLEDFVIWLKKQPFKYKIVVAGNHDIIFDTENYRSKLKDQYHYKENFNESDLIDNLKRNCIYLMNSSVTIEGYKIWGSPYSLEHWGKGFQLPKDRSRIMWSQIEDDADIVITHGPPYGHGDFVKGFHVGDEELLKRILFIKPKYHLFGHIHQGYGISNQSGITFINSSLLNQDYQYVNKPVVFTLPKKN